MKKYLFVILFFNALAISEPIQIEGHIIDDDGTFQRTMQIARDSKRGNQVILVDAFFQPHLPADQRSWSTIEIPHHDSFLLRAIFSDGVGPVLVGLSVNRKDQSCIVWVAVQSADFFTTHEWTIARVFKFDDALILQTGGTLDFPSIVFHPFSGTTKLREENVGINDQRQPVLLPIPINFSPILSHPYVDANGDFVIPSIPHFNFDLDYDNKGSMSLNRVTVAAPSRPTVRISSPPPPVKQIKIQVGIMGTNSCDTVLLNS